MAEGLEIVPAIKAAVRPGNDVVSLSSEPAAGRTERISRKEPLSLGVPSRTIWRAQAGRLYLQL